MTTDNKTALRPFAHVLAVPDLARSARYFHEVLGFTTDWQDGDDWHTLHRGSARVMLGHCPDALLPAQLGDHAYFAYWHVDDVDALFAEFASRDAIILQAPANKPWGMREMAIATPDGHRMMIGQSVDAT
ncbi:MAG: VOC family protein [Rhodocyclaceae bacterium]